MNQMDYMIATIENTSRLAISKMTDTYEKDGLIYCSKCNAPLQAWVKGPADANGVRKERLMPVICDCIRERERIAKEHQERRDFERRLVDLRRAVGMGDDVGGTFDADDSSGTKKSQTCRKYVERWDDMKRENIGILFCGPAGTGKTFYAECIVNALAEKGVSTAIVPMSVLVSRVQSDRDRDEIYDAVRAFDLLVLDDIDSERSTSFGMEVVYNVVNIRYAKRRPTFFTTNLSLKELQQEQDRDKARIYDRISEMCPVVFKMNGESSRPVIAELKRGQAKRVSDEQRRLEE